MGEMIVWLNEKELEGVKNEHMDWIYRRKERDQFSRIGQAFAAENLDHYFGNSTLRRCIFRVLHLLCYADVSIVCQTVCQQPRQRAEFNDYIRRYFSVPKSGFNIYGYPHK